MCLKRDKIYNDIISFIIRVDMMKGEERIAPELLHHPTFLTVNNIPECFPLWIPGFERLCKISIKRDCSPVHLEVCLPDAENKILLRQAHRVDVSWGRIGDFSEDFVTRWRMDGRRG